MTASHSSSECCTAAWRRMMPALLTRTSMRPNASSAPATSASAAARSARSAVNTSVRRPDVAAMRWAVDFAGCSLLCNATSAPAEASAMATAAPRPREAPVTSATWPSSRKPLVTVDEGVLATTTGARSPRPKKSSRGGEKMSINTTSSSSIVAPCGVLDGNSSRSPAEALRPCPSTTKLTLPRSTSVICSWTCECTGVTVCGASRKRHTISRSPYIIWRSIPSAICSASIADQSRC